MKTGTTIQPANTAGIGIRIRAKFFRYDGGELTRREHYTPISSSQRT
jgi:hypothetical protein